MAISGAAQVSYFLHLASRPLAAVIMDCEKAAGWGWAAGLLRVGWAGNWAEAGQATSMPTFDLIIAHCNRVTAAG